MAPKILIDARWLGAVSEDDLAAIELLRQLDLEAIPLTLDSTGAILAQYQASLRPGTFGRKFFTSRLTSGRTEFAAIDEGAHNPDIAHWPKDSPLAPYIAAAVALGGGVVLATTELDDALRQELGQMGVQILGPEAVRSLLQARVPTEQRIALILTALALECQEVMPHLIDWTTEEHAAGTVYRVGTLHTQPRWRVVVGITGAQNARAAVETERAITRFRPDVALFVGVAGGVKDVTLGDVVAGEFVTTYDTGKASATALSRPLQHNPAYRLKQRSLLEITSGTWRDDIQPGHGALATDTPPRAFLGPIAAGGWIVASTKSKVYALIRKQHSDVLVVEMEGYGFLEAAYENKVDAIVIRGISDLIDGKTDADAHGSQEQAASHAAAFACRLLAGLT